MNINIPINYDFINRYKDKLPPWGEVGYITYKRTYARPLDDRTEEWWETVGRCVKGLMEIGGIFTQEEIEELYDHVFNLRCCFSGRALWQLGTHTVHKYGSDSLQNCWFVNVDNLESFTFTMNELMLGGGVGFSVQPEHIYKLPRVRKATITLVDSFDVDFIVADNREGWIELLRKVLKAYLVRGKGFTYTTRCIRSKGKQISSFGGVSSGPDELVRGIKDICAILDKANGNYLSSVNCLDIMNIIGRIVVAGNVRRSAELAIGEYNDLDFLRAKRWDKNNIPNWRSMSNNSVACNNIHDLPEEFWEGYHGNGEPYGLINLYNARQYGRIMDGKDYRPDEGVNGFNPCAEIGLEDHESCNLSEIYLPNIDGCNELKRVAGLMYKSCKTIAGWPFNDKKTNEVVTRNQRLGIGITGVYQTSFGFSDLADTYTHLEELDEKYSKEIGRRQSVKLTTVKPSGTLSLLPGVTPGAHPAYSKYQVRRIRFSSNSPLLQKCIEAGYHAEEQLNFDGTTDPSTIVVSFPVKYANAVVAKSVSALGQLEMLKALQSNWSDNAVSITVYYHPEELNGIREWLERNYNDNLKSVSFLRHSEHGFKQAPLEEITENVYNVLKENTKPIVSFKEDSLEETINIDECEGNTCPIR